MFALFRLNYHNQYYAAWSDSQQLGQVKRLWLEALSGFSADLILRGARRAIEGSEYLPTLKRMLGSCAEALAELGMQWELSRREAKFAGHVYTSKEASSGGSGAAGGGCGCN